MAVSRSKGRDDFLLATWDALGDVTYNYNVKIAIDLIPTERRGVFRIRVRAFRPKPNAGYERLAVYERLYPTSEISELSAGLFSAANKLDHMLAEIDRDATREREMGG